MVEWVGRWVRVLVHVCMYCTASVQYRIVSYRIVVVVVCTEYVQYSMYCNQEIIWLVILVILVILVMVYKDKNPSLGTLLRTVCLSYSVTRRSMA